MYEEALIQHTRPAQKMEPNRHMNDNIQLKRQFDQLKIQKERDEITFKQALEKRERDFEYRVNEIIQQEQMKEQKECQLLREDLTYKLHVCDVLVQQQLKQEKDEIYRMDEQISQMSIQFKEELTALEQQCSLKIQQKNEELLAERAFLQQQLQAQSKLFQQRQQQDMDKWRLQMKQDKQELAQSIDYQRQNDSRQVIETYDKRILQIQEESDRREHEMRDENDKRLQSQKEQLDMEKTNTALFRRKAQEAKKQYDQDIEGLKQEHQIIMNQNRQEIVEERRRRESIEKEFDCFRKESYKLQAEAADEHEQRETMLRLRLQNQINEMYQRQIEVVQQLERQSMDLDEASEIKYQKLKNQYNELQDMVSGPQDNRRPSIRRNLPRKLDENPSEPLGEVLSVLNKVQQYRPLTHNGSMRQKKKLL